MLAFCQFFLPKLHPEVIVNAKLFMALQEQGHLVDILALRNDRDNNYVYSRAEEAWWASIAPHIYNIVLPQHSKYVQVGLDWLNLFLTGFHFRNISSWRTEYHVAKKLIDKNHYDYILFRGPGPMFFSAWRLSQEYHIPLIINLSDPWYSFPTPYPTEKHIRFKRFMVKRMLSRADAITFPSQELLEYTRESYPDIAQLPLKVVPHIFRNIEVAPDVSELPPSSTFVITHAGSWGMYRNPEKVFRTLRRLADKHPEITFQFNVIGLANPLFDRMIKACKVENIVNYLGCASYEKTLGMLSSSTVLLLLEADCEKGIFLPSKFIDYLQVRRPILAISPQKGCIADYFDKFHIGEFANVKSEEEIDRALQTLVDHFKKNQLGDYDFSSAIEYFTNVPIRQTEMLLDQIAHTKQRGL